jgi:hypothetical protein
MGKSKPEPIGVMPKINCLACGKECDGDSKYCKHCGAPTKPLEIPPHLKPKKSRKKLLVVLLVVMMIIGTISVFLIISYEDVDETKTYTYSPDTTPRSLKIELDMDSASVEIYFTSDLDEPLVKLDYHKKWSGFIVSQSSFKTSSSKVSFEGSIVVGEANSELIVTLRNDVEYDINGISANGNIALNAEDRGVILGTIDLDTTSGSSSIFGKNLTVTKQIKLKSESGSSSVFLKDCQIGDIEGNFNSGSSALNLENCTIEDILVTGNSGSATLKSKDLKIDSQSSWSFDIDSGSVVLDLDQSSALGGNIEVDAQISGNKEIEVSINGNATNVRAKLTGNQDINIKKNLGFDIIDTKTLESYNYNNETIDKFEIKMNAEGGDLEVEVVNS